MYRPSDMERPQYPMFKKVNGRIISFLSLKGALALGASVLFAIALAFLLGVPKVAVEVKTTQAEQLEVKTILNAEHAAVSRDATQTELALYQNETHTGAKTGITEDEYARYLELSQELSKYDAILSACTKYSEDELTLMAKEDGITYETTQDALEDKVLLVKTEQTDAIALPVRWAVAIAVIGLALMLLCEFGGERSLALKLIDSARFSSAQHTYTYKRCTGSHFEN